MSDPLRPLKELVPLSWRVAVRRQQAALARKLHPHHRSSFVEDFVRVYAPDVRVTDADVRETTLDERNNFLNHQKIYRFASQFIQPGKPADVLDAGCGSGHGCALLHEAGAETVLGIDMSEHALAFARERHAGPGIVYEQMSVTAIRRPPSSFDLLVCSEVLEHVLEFGTERKTMRELHRVLRPGGIAVLATPNAEMLPNHGYRFDQLRDLVASFFPEIVFFENFYLPFIPEERENWEARLKQGRVGLVPTLDLQVEETCPPPEYDLTQESDLERLRRQVKEPTMVEPPSLGGRRVDTRHLHNSHSFLVVALKR